jgi:hypothetical protein
MGTWESSRTPKTSEFDCMGQNTSPWSVFHVIGKLLKCRCRKWPCMIHLNVYRTSYGKKKSWESNWQLDSRPLKVGNQPDPNVCRWRATHHWKALNENYKFASDLILIKGLSKELWIHKVPGVQTGIVLGLLLGSHETKSHSDVGATSNAKNTIWEKVVASPESGPWWVLWNQSCLWLVLAPRVLQNAN